MLSQSIGLTHSRCVFLRLFERSLVDFFARVVGALSSLGHGKFFSPHEVSRQMMNLTGMSLDEILRDANFRNLSDLAQAFPEQLSKQGDRFAVKITDANRAHAMNGEMKISKSRGRSRGDTQTAVSAEKCISFPKTSCALADRFSTGEPAVFQTASIGLEVVKVPYLGQKLCFCGSL
ncbi:unnamed protein product [Caenorhabditis auriculariae]|uniref:Uncharacterized protein n=1 Tax=Caenorhabditis auriculariae TaxID=2777116 RepID=A0A8S1HPF6_9PELO|nr:unnamed protein product [Caenorhabditis auriculariae]